MVANRSFVIKPSHFARKKLHRVFPRSDQETEREKQFNGSEDREAAGDNGVERGRERDASAALGGGRSSIVWRMPTQHSFEAN